MAIYDINGNEITGGGSSVPTFLNGKKYIAMGDSIVDTQGSNTVKVYYTGSDLQGNTYNNLEMRGYVRDIEDRYGLIATAYGDSGGYIKRNYAKRCCIDYSNVALVTIAFGTNDAHYSYDIGTVNALDSETYAGCLNHLVQKIQMDNPECRIIICTPPQRLTVNGFGSWTHGDGGANTPTLEDYANMAKSVAQRNSIPCADFFHDGGLNQTNLYYYSKDGVHPLNSGFKIMSNCIIPIVDDLVKVEYSPEASMTIPSSPASANNTPVEVPLTDSMFTETGTRWNSTDNPANTTTMKQVAEGIQLINGMTYLYDFYLPSNNLTNRTFAVNDSASAILGSSVWGSGDTRKAGEVAGTEVINGTTYYKIRWAIAVPLTGTYYIWPAILNALGAEYVSLKYF